MFLYAKHLHLVGQRRGLHLQKLCGAFRPPYFSVRVLQRGDQIGFLELLEFCNSQELGTVTWLIVRD